jgi:hypothetical protein
MLMCAPALPFGETEQLVSGPPWLFLVSFRLEALPTCVAAQRASALDTCICLCFLSMLVGLPCLAKDWQSVSASALWDRLLANVCSCVVEPNAC